MPEPDPMHATVSNGREVDVPRSEPLEPEPPVADGTAETFSFTPIENGTYNVSYKVTDDDGGVGTDTAVITVNNVAPTIFVNNDTVTVH